MIARPRVFVIAPIRVYRDALTDALGLDGRTTVVGSDATPDGLLVCLTHGRIEVVIVEATAVARDTIAAIHRADQSLAILALGTVDDELELRALVGMGVVAMFVPATASLEDLTTSIAAARDRHRLFMRHPPTSEVTLIAGDPSRDRGLTRREAEIMSLLELELSNKEIAFRLQIEVATVKNHVHNILEKLNASTRREAVERVRRPGPRASRTVQVLPVTDLDRRRSLV